LRLPERFLAGGLAGSAFQSSSRFWVAVFDSSEHGLEPVELLHTTDAGRSWIDDGSFPRDYGDAWIDFLTPRRGWLMVGNGAAANQEPVTIYETDSGGARWSERAQSPIPTIAAGTPGAPSPGCDKSGVTFATATSGWIAGYCNGLGELQHTTDGGRRWRTLLLARPSKVEWGGDASAPKFFTASSGAFAADLFSAHGSTAVIYTTADAGASWTSHRTPATSQASVGPIDILSPTAWMISDGATLYETTSAGANWTAVPSTVDYSGFAADALDFVNQTDGWAISQDGRLWHTTDGGHIWTTLPVRT